MQLCIWFPQERVFPYSTWWFDSGRLWLRTLHYLHLPGHVCCGQCLRGHRWHPNTPEGVYNPLPRSALEDISIVQAGAWYVHVKWGKSGQYKDTGELGHTWLLIRVLPWLPCSVVHLQRLLEMDDLSVTIEDHAYFQPHSEDSNGQCNDL